MNTPALSVGKDMVCYCTRCKMDLGHMIMSMVGPTPARVMCRTCKSEHNYKPKRGVKEPGGVAPSRGVPGSTTRTPRAAREVQVEKTVPVELEWMRQLNASTAAMKEYAADQAFVAGDRIKHPVFGEGIIQKLVFPNKVEVLFKMDVKTLIHAGKPA
jgi:hypothetical protein